MELVKYLKSQKVLAWSMDELKGGMDWEFETLRAISEAHFVLLLLSQSGAKERGFFQKTIRVAKEKQAEMLPGDIFLVPILLDEMVDYNSLRMPQEPLRVRKSEDWQILGKVLKHGKEQRF